MTISQDPDVARLLDDGYVVVEQAGHLVIQHIPYVTEQREIAYGFLTYPITMSGDRMVSGTDHRIWFGGTTPCDERGQRLPLATPEPHPVTDGVQADFMLSSKPTPSGYSNEYDKVTAYARIICDQAKALDALVTATPGAAWTEIEPDSPFCYRDTATSRAGLTVIHRRFRGERVAIIGLGGSGGYVLDQVAKTEVDSIALFDGDTFENHNAFRAPGAPSIDTLRQRPYKASYFAGIYQRMHRRITAHDVFIDAQSLELLDGATFVFLALDDSRSKQTILDWLETRDVPFIDVGMGVEEVDGHLSGLLRVSTSTPGRQTAARARIPQPSAHLDDYGRNIQTADLNALNAMLAVLRWKRHLGIYADLTHEGFSTYSVSTNEIVNEDTP